MSSKYWSDYWKTTGKSGEVFINQQGDKPEYLNEFWDTYLQVEEKDIVLDIACGAGSVFEHLTSKQKSIAQIFATDFSEVALQTLKNRLSGIQPIKCCSDSLPYASNSIDKIYSQFGIEYAGLDAFKELSRVIKKNGSFTLISHYKDGFIDQKNKSFLNGANVALQSNFIETGMNLIKATLKSSNKKLKIAKQQFKMPEIILAKAVREIPEGIHSHLYYGFIQIYSKLNNYDPEDIYSWLEAMKKDIKINIYKVSEIRQVALSQNDISEIHKIFRLNGITDVISKPLYIPDSKNIVGWHINRSVSNGS